jgi:GNAT superfamily N-acetyltransferase
VYRSWVLAVERSEELAFSLSATTAAPIVRLVAELDGRVVGTAVAEGASPLPHGRWSVRILVEPGSRRQGVGGALADPLEVSLPARHPDLVATVADDDPASAASAERRRFRPWQHSIVSTLDLAATAPREPRVPVGVEVRVLAVDAPDAAVREAYEVFLATAVGLCPSVLLRTDTASAVASRDPTQFGDGQCPQRLSPQPQVRLVLGLIVLSFHLGLLGGVRSP